jgi:hypothetical protein
MWIAALLLTSKIRHDELINCRGLVQLHRSLPLMINNMFDTFTT